jgi:predicted RNA-binding protein YlxR (DUF448 family)
LRKLPNERLTSQSRTPAKAGGQNEGKTGPRLSPGNSADHTPERKCILSGDHAARDALVRLALSPDGEIFPDVRAKAPGRGAWIGVDRPTLESALAKGKLKGALSRAFKTNAITIGDDLGARIEDALRQSVLDRLGLEARSGYLLTGSDKINTAARSGQVHALIHAADAGADSRRKLDQAWRVGEGEEGSGRQGVVFPADRAILSLALGRQNVVHVAIIDHAAAARVDHALGRWRAFIGRDDTLEAASAAVPAVPDEDVSEGSE